MGGCTSCLRLLLNEADVKIHVIEPTSVMGGGENVEPIAIQPSPSTLQVPPLNRPRTPTEQKEMKHDEKEGNEVKDVTPVTSLQIPTTTATSLTIPEVIPVKPKISPSNSLENH